MKHNRRLNTSSTTARGKIAANHHSRRAGTARRQRVELAKGYKVLNLRLGDELKSSEGQRSEDRPADQRGDEREG